MIGRYTIEILEKALQVDVLRNDILISHTAPVAVGVVLNLLRKALDSPATENAKVEEDEDLSMEVTVADERTPSPRSMHLNIRVGTGISLAKSASSLIFPTLSSVIDSDNTLYRATFTRTQPREAGISSIRLSGKLSPYNLKIGLVILETCFALYE